MTQFQPGDRIYVLPGMEHPSGGLSAGAQLTVRRVQFRDQGEKALVYTEEIPGGFLACRFGLREPIAVNSEAPAFSPGDRVRVLPGHEGKLGEGTKAGDVFTVSETRPGSFGAGPLVFLSERPSGSFYQRRFELHSSAGVEASAPDLGLNPADPFEANILDMVALNRRKRADYALDTDAWSNFRQTAELFGGGMKPSDAVRFNICQKIVRLRALAENGRKPQNESVVDTANDLAVYSVILGILLAEEAEAETGGSSGTSPR